MAAPFLGKLKKLNDERKEKKRFSREYVKNLEPELQKVVSEAGLDVLDERVREQLRESQLNLGDSKRRKELLQLLGLQPPDPDTYDLKVEECGNGKHKLLPCGHLTPGFIFTICDETCASGESWLVAAGLPLKKRNAGRKRVELYKDYLEGRLRENDHDSILHAESEQLDLGPDNQNCTTCVFRNFQQSFYFIMQEVKYNGAELIEAVEDEPYLASVPGLHRMVDFKFQNPDGGFLGGSVPVQIWEIFQKEQWGYVNAIGTAINNPELVYSDIAIPPEHESFDPELGYDQRLSLSNTKRRAPDFLPYDVEEDIRKEYFFSLLDPRNRGGKPRKKVRFDDFGSAEMVRVQSFGQDSPPIHCKVPMPRPTYRPPHFTTSTPSNCSSTSSTGSIGHIRPMNSLAGVSIPRSWNLSVDMDKQQSFERLNAIHSMHNTNIAKLHISSTSEGSSGGCEGEGLQKPMPEHSPNTKRKPLPSTDSKQEQHIAVSSAANPRCFRKRMQQPHPDTPINRPPYHTPTLPPTPTDTNTSKYPPSSRPSLPKLVVPESQTNPPTTHHQAINPPIPTQSSLPPRGNQLLHGDPFGSPDSTPKSPKSYHRFFHGLPDYPKEKCPSPRLVGGLQDARKTARFHRPVLADKVISRRGAVDCWVESTGKKESVGRAKGNEVGGIDGKIEKEGVADVWLAVAEEVAPPEKEKGEETETKTVQVNEAEDLWLAFAAREYGAE